MAFPFRAPCEAGTAGPVPQRVVKGSQPTQCMTLGLARGSGPFEPPTGESAPLAPPLTPAAPFSLSHDRALDGARSDRDEGVRTGRLHGPDLGSARWPSREGSLWRERPRGAG